MTGEFRGATEVVSRGGKVVARRVREARLTAIEGPAEGTVATFARDVFVVGSAPECDLVLADPSVSRRHVEIALSGDGFRIRDAGSTNGTFVGAMRIGEIVVTETVTLVLGETVLRFEPLGTSVEAPVSQSPRFGRLVSVSVAMREAFAALEKAAASDLSILLLGETGTGKELAAEAVHEASVRASGPLVALDCGAIARDLVESELFGHVRGAFTGAARDRKGALESASGGTLFLDEIGELPPDLQPKLLRALEKREVRPVGAERTVAADVRIVAATNRDLAREVEAGRFRKDLYYRLAVVTVRLPPLRARPEDIPVLVQTFLGEVDRRRRAMGQPPLAPLAPEAMAALASYAWPGNVRELRNVVERWAVLGGDPAPAEAQPAQSSPHGLLTLPLHEARDRLVEDFERRYLEALLERTSGNVSAAAREAGVDRRYMQRLLAKHGLRGEGTAGAVE